jgi:two-component system, LytTR family, response regulator
MLSRSMDNVYNCIIVDDNEVDRLMNVSFVKRYPFLRLAGAFSSARDAIPTLEKADIVVAFLDIDMKEINGLELRRKFLDLPVCIFITAYPDHALESFELAALDFLAKPVKAARFEASMQRLHTWLDTWKNAALFKYSLDGETVFIKEGHQQVKLRLSEILYLEALKDYTGIVTPARKYCVLTSLGNLLKEETFHTFLRIHRSYAVQRRLIDRIAPQQVFVNNIPLPVGRRYKAALDEIK